MRTAYEYFGESRGSLEVISTSEKKTSKVNVHLWDRGGGKDAWRKYHAYLLQGIAAEINREPDRACLVIHHNEDDRSWKVGKVPNIPESLAELIEGDPNRVSFCSWGRHKQTNKYASIDKVILTGTLFYPESVYEVRTRASLGLDIEAEVDRETMAEIIDGEIRNDLLQAINRGSMRRCVGDEASAMDLYVIGSISTPVPGLIKELLPQSEIHRWNPLEEPLTGKVGEALRYIDAWMEANPDLNSQLRIREVTEALGMNSSNFKTECS